MSSDDQLSKDLQSLRLNRNDLPALAAKPSAAGWRTPVASVAVLVVLVATWRALAPRVEAQWFQTEVEFTQVYSVSPAQAAVELASSGYVVPQIVAKVGTKVVGRVQQVKAREGATVEAGALLFVLDPSDQRSAFLASTARVASASARVSAARAALAEAELQAARQGTLAQSGAVSAASAEDLGARVATLREQMRAQQSEVKAAEADTTALQVGLGHTSILAPIRGVLSSKPPELGDTVSPSLPLVELVDFDSLLVETDVPEGRLSKVQPGGAAAVMIDALGTQSYPAHVVEISPKLNRSKGTATVKVKFEMIPAGLRPEMSARVNFLSKPLTDAQRNAQPVVLVPAAAVVGAGPEAHVWLVERNKVRRVSVSLGPTQGSDFPLLQGPSIGATLVKSPPSTLADGLAVKEKTR